VDAALLAGTFCFEERREVLSMPNASFSPSLYYPLLIPPLPLSPPSLPPSLPPSPSFLPNRSWTANRTQAASVTP